MGVWRYMFIFFSSLAVASAVFIDFLFRVLVSSITGDNYRRTATLLGIGLETTGCLKGPLISGAILTSVNRFSY
jgi:hypothetical protein